MRSRTLAVTLMVVLVVSALGAALVVPRAAAEPPTPAGETIPYTGQLSDGAGTLVPDGTYQVNFSLYRAETGGAAVWTESQVLEVRSGLFSARLGSIAPLTKELMDSPDLWLEVSIKGPNESSFTTLSPRQALSAMTPSGNVGVQALTCPHSHFGDSWTGTNNYYGLSITNNGTGDGVRGYSYASDKTYAGLYGRNYSTGSGVFGASDDGPGIYGKSTTGDGVEGEATAATKSGVYGHTGTTNAYGVSGTSLNGFGMSANGKDDSAEDNYGDLWLGGQFGEIFSDYLLLFSDWNITLHLDHDNHRTNAYFAIVNGTGNPVLNMAEDGNLIISGALTALGGKAGYVMDVSRNAGTEPLTAGDVVAIVGASEPVLGRIPVVEVRKATSADSSAVMGVVDQRFKPGSSGAVALRSASTPDGAEPQYDDAPVAQGEYLTVVTLGSFRTIKVDTSYGAIQPGALLVASPNPGYAMKATSSEAGTIIGKALGTLSSGTGEIPVLITMQ